MMLITPIPMKKLHPLNYSISQLSLERRFGYVSFASGHSEDEILPTSDALVSEHTEIILVEEEIGLSKERVR